MGLVFSRWKTKPSTVEVLETIEKDIETIEKQQRRNLERERRLVGYLLLYSVLLYAAVTCIFYFYYLPDAWADRMKYSIPLVFFPILIWAVKRFLQWYFVKRITKNEFKLEVLREKKKGILDEVMETHTYKKAKEILERFDSSGGTKLNLTEQSTPTRPVADGQELRQRNKATPTTEKPPAETSLLGAAAGPSNSSVAATPSPMPSGSGRRMLNTAPGSAQHPPQWGQAMRPPGPPMARPVLPRERSASERVLEYLIGDGPQNRYALVCQQCHSHNGMAYKEEFDYLNFRCCYCFTFNKARRQRPNAPALETPPTVHRQLNVNQEPESGTDAEVESGTDAESSSDTKKDK